ncbi:hypothetical protein SALBM311S_10497 [Streptomyces alboniger]
MEDEEPGFDPDLDPDFEGFDDFEDLEGPDDLDGFDDLHEATREEFCLPDQRSPSSSCSSASAASSRPDFP